MRSAQLPQLRGPYGPMTAEQRSQPDDFRALAGAMRPASCRRRGCTVQRILDAINFFTGCPSGGFPRRSCSRRTAHTVSWLWPATDGVADSSHWSGPPVSNGKAMPSGLRKARAGANKHVEKGGRLLCRVSGSVICDLAPSSVAFWNTRAPAVSPGGGAAVSGVRRTARRAQRPGHSEKLPFGIRRGFCRRWTI